MNFSVDMKLSKDFLVANLAQRYNTIQGKHYIKRRALSTIVFLKQKFVLHVAGVKTRFFLEQLSLMLLEYIMDSPVKD